MLNESKGNMYPFVSHTWNMIKGKCPHNCSYCYMKKWREPPPLHLDKKESKTDLGKDNFIFVGSSCDMWAWGIPEEWILEILNHCNAYPSNRYLFQSKNPPRIENFYGLFPDRVLFGTTIESNRDYESGPPAVGDRYISAVKIGKENGGEIMVTIEPIMDFDLNELVEMMEDIEPSWINIGANTNVKIKLHEPDRMKTLDLISALKEISEVKLKANLKRIVGNPI